MHKSDNLLPKTQTLEGELVMHAPEKAKREFAQSGRKKERRKPSKPGRHKGNSQKKGGGDLRTMAGDLKTIKVL